MFKGLGLLCVGQDPVYAFLEWKPACREIQCGRTKLAPKGRRGMATSPLSAGRLERERPQTVDGWSSRSRSTGATPTRGSIQQSIKKMQNISKSNIPITTEIRLLDAELDMALDITEQASERGEILSTCGYDNMPEPVSATNRPGLLNMKNMQLHPAPWKGWSQACEYLESWERTRSPSSVASQSPHSLSPRRRPGKMFNTNYAHFATYHHDITKARYNTELAPGELPAQPEPQSETPKSLKPNACFYKHSFDRFGFQMTPTCGKELGPGVYHREGKRMLMTPTLQGARSFGVLEDISMQGYTPTGFSRCKTNSRPSSPSSSFRNSGRDAPVRPEKPTPIPAVLRKQQAQKTAETLLQTRQLN